MNTLFVTLFNMYMQENIYILNSVTKATMVRVEILKAIKDKCSSNRETLQEKTHAGSFSLKVFLLTIEEG